MQGYSITEWVLLVIVASFITFLFIGGGLFTNEEKKKESTRRYKIELFTYSAVLFIFIGSMTTVSYDIIKYEKWVSETFIPEMEEKSEVFEVKGRDINSIEVNGDVVLVEYILENELQKFELVKHRDNVKKGDVLGINVGIVKYTDEVSEPVMTYRVLEERAHYRLPKGTVYTVELHVPKDFK